MLVSASIFIVSALLIWELENCEGANFEEVNALGSARLSLLDERYQNPVTFYKDCVVRVSLYFCEIPQKLLVVPYLKCVYLSPTPYRRPVGFVQF